jgi:two-component system NtrC family response regulator
LEKCDWNQTHAARYLDLSRKTLIYRMERHGIRRPQERQLSN